MFENVLFGNNSQAGDLPAGAGFGQGTVFRLDGPLPPPLTATALHVFAGATVSPPDGQNPVAGLTAGPFHLLYGVTGGTDHDNDYGIVYSISPSAANPRYTIIHRFDHPGPPVHDGIIPGNGLLAVDAQGRLCGATQRGGLNTTGAVYALQFLNGAWREQVVYSFPPNFQGALGGPLANVVLDAAGNIYGCAPYGPYLVGGVFRVSPPAVPGGAWTETDLAYFGAHAGDPIVPIDQPVGSCGVTFDAASGKLFGTSPAGGQMGFGTIFELDPPAAGQTGWTLQVDHSFGNGDGGHPTAPMIQVGNTFYGTAGTVFSFIP